MSTVSELKRRFLTAFSDEQSSLLADIFYSHYESLAKSSDLKELSGIVTELARAQKDTDATVKELAEAQKRTEVKVEELAEAQKKTDTSVKELAEAQKKTEVTLEELSKEVRNLAKQVGGLSEAIGGSLGGSMIFTNSKSL